MTRAPLAEVCALQWRSAHEAALQAAAEGFDRHAVRYEDLVGPPERRAAAARALAAFLAIPEDQLRVVHPVTGGQGTAALARRRSPRGRSRR